MLRPALAAFVALGSLWVSGLARAQSVAPGPPPPDQSPPAQYVPPPPPEAFPPAAPGPALRTSMPPPPRTPTADALDAWKPGMAVPPGYHPVQHARKWMVIVGSITFGVSYLNSVVLAAVGPQVQGESGNGLTALFVPVVGPFIALGNPSVSLKQDGVELAFLGLGQLAGITLFALGLALPQTKLAPNLTADRSLQLSVSPMFAARATGLSLSARF